MIIVDEVDHQANPHVSTDIASEDVATVTGTPFHISVAHDVEQRQKHLKNNVFSTLFCLEMSVSQRVTIITDGPTSMENRMIREPMMQLGFIPIVDVY